jgi:hypothetical protein
LRALICGKNADLLSALLAKKTPNISEHSLSCQYREQKILSPESIPLSPMFTETEKLDPSCSEEKTYDRVVDETLYKLDDTVVVSKNDNKTRLTFER